MYQHKEILSGVIDITGDKNDNDTSLTDNQQLVIRDVLVNLRGNNGVFWASFPAIPGCFTCGVYPDMLDVIHNGCEWIRVKGITTGVKSNYNDINEMILDVVEFHTAGSELGYTVDTDFTKADERFEPMSNLYRTIKCHIWVNK